MDRKGFTLIEVLIAMSIFVVFISVLVGTYTSIVKGQNKANQYRLLYSESREIFDTLLFDLRNMAVDYGVGNQVNEFSLQLLSKDGESRVNYDFNGDERSLSRNNEVLNEEVYLKDFDFFISPKVDPYAQSNALDSVNQFQPKVTVYAEFGKMINGNDEVTMELQTTVSSRIYSQVLAR